jgi:hypothetical protein
MSVSFTNRNDGVLGKDRADLDAKAPIEFWRHADVRQKKIARERPGLLGVGRGRRIFGVRWPSLAAWLQSALRVKSTATQVAEA